MAATSERSTPRYRPVRRAVIYLKPVGAAWIDAEIAGAASVARASRPALPGAVAVGDESECARGYFEELPAMALP